MSTVLNKIVSWNISIESWSTLAEQPIQQPFRRRPRWRPLHPLQQRPAIQPTATTAIRRCGCGCRRRLPTATGMAGIGSFLRCLTFLAKSDLFLLSIIFLLLTYVVCALINHDCNSLPRKHLCPPSSLGGCLPIQRRRRGVRPGIGGSIEPGMAFSLLEYTFNGRFFKGDQILNNV